MLLYGKIGYNIFWLTNMKIFGDMSYDVKANKLKALEQTSSCHSDHA